MKKILFAFLFALIFSGCTSTWIGDSNDFVITKIEYSKSADKHRVYIKGECCKNLHYFYTTERYRVGDTLTIGLNKRDTIYE